MVSFFSLFSLRVVEAYYPLATYVKIFCQSLRPDTDCDDGRHVIINFFSHVVIRFLLTIL